MDKKTDSFEALLSPVVKAMGYEFVGCEYRTHGQFSTLRIYIDNDKGVTLDGCSLVSKQLSAVLDVEDPVGSRYSLEVSSPGLERPLFTAEQFKKAIGRKIKLILHSPFCGNKKFTGFLDEVREHDVILTDVSGLKVNLPFQAIAKAILLADEEIFKD